MEYRTRHSGFALIMVLLVLTLAAAALALTARRSMQAAVEAGSELEQLQVRWGAVSCRRALLPRASSFLGGDPFQERQEPRIVHSEAVTLGNLRFRFIVSNEQAKPNVNMLAARRQIGGLDSVIDSLQAGLPRPLPARPAPLAVTPDRVAAVPDRYGSFDQVFDRPRPSRLVGDQEAEGPADRITCWGSGKLDFRAARPEALRVVTAGILDETKLAKLLQMRREEPALALSTLISQLQLKPAEARQLSEVLTDESNCQSLWVIVSGASRDYYRFYVDQAGDTQNDSRHLTYGW